MLKLLRKKGVMKKLIWFIAVIIILSFGIFGTAYLLNDTNPGSANYAGKIFGKKVSIEDYQKALADVRVQSIIRYGDKYNEVRPYLNFEAQTWDRLIVLKEADRLGIKVKNQEIVDTIQNYEFFQRNGQFDTPLYNDVVRYVFEMKPRNFEESIRDSIKMSKVIAQTTKDIAITEEEALDVFKKQNEKVQISYLFFTPENYKDQSSYTEEEARQYYSDNQLEFLVPYSINVEFVKFDLIEDGDDAQTVNDAIFDKASTIYEKAFESKDLAAVAQDNGLTIQTSGFFSREEPNLTLGWSFDVFNQIFQLEKGDILPPIQSGQSVLLIKLAESREAYVPEYEEAQEKVADKVRRINAKDIAKNEAEKTLASLEEKYAATTDFSQAAEELGLEIKQTPEFLRGQYLPKIGISSSFQDAAFRLSQTNKISGIVSTETGFYILHLDSHVSADPAGFVEEKEKIMQQLLAQKRTASFEQYLASLRAKANLEDLIARQRQEAETN